MSFSYLKNITIISVLMFILIALFNYLMNPFDIFNLKRKAGVNQYKPSISERVRLTKKYQPHFNQYKTIIVGNSRVEMGLNPDSPFLKSYSPVYNLGIPGLGVNGQIAYLESILENSDNVENVIISLDFLDFLTSRNKKQFSAYSIEANVFNDVLNSTLSLDATTASISTLFKQSATSANRLHNGFNTAKDYIPIINSEGQEVLFKQKLNQLHNNLKGKTLDLSLLEADNSPMQTLLELLVKLDSKNINTFIFINPYHENYYLAIEQEGLIKGFNNWKRFIESRISKISNICDFTALGKKMSDIAKNEEELLYFWEPSHYKEELGEIMLPQILSRCAE